MQLGVAESDFWASQNACEGAGAWLDGSMNFVWTPDALGGGALCRADWYDEDSNGQIDNPVIGATYDMWIEIAVVSGALRWRYCIDRVGNATLADCDATRSRYSHSMGGSWHGFETQKVVDALGARDNQADIWVVQPQYKVALSNTTSTGWTYLNGDSAADWTDPRPAYYQASTQQLSPGERLRGWTFNHDCAVPPGC